jgi:Zinc finger, C3HC4 type (RING finger)
LDEEMKLFDESGEDGEIIDDTDFDPEQVKRNLFQENARKALAKTLNPEPLQKPDLSKPSSSQLKDAKPAGIPDEMLCIACLDNRKEIMIQSCRHLVFCKGC